MIALFAVMYVHTNISQYKKNTYERREDADLWSHQLATRQKDPSDRSTEKGETVPKKDGNFTLKKRAYHRES